MSDRELIGDRRGATGVVLGTWVYGAIVLVCLLLLTLLMQVVGVRELGGAEAPRTLRVVSPLEADTVKLALTWTPAEEGTSPVVQYVYELLAGPGVSALVMVERDSVDVDQERYASWDAPRPPAGTCTHVQARVIARDSRGLLSRDGWGMTDILQLCTPAVGPSTPVARLDTTTVAYLLPDSISTYPVLLELALGGLGAMCAYRWDGPTERPLQQARWAVTDPTIGMRGPPSAPDSSHCMVLEALGVPAFDPGADEVERFSAAWRTWMRTARGEWPAFVSAWEAGEVP